MTVLDVEKCPLFRESGSTVLITPFGKNIKDYPKKGSYGDHYGVDIVRNVGYNTTADVTAIDDGVIVELRRDVQGTDHVKNTAGNYIKLSHGNGYFSRYLHLKYASVPESLAVGVTVRRGEVIGRMGNTGDSYGAHLHFEIEKDGEKVDPVPYITGEKKFTDEENDMYRVIIDAEYDEMKKADAMCDMLAAFGIRALAVSNGKEAEGKSVSTVTHKVVKGDTLGKIAKKYGVSVDEIVEDNKQKYPKITPSYIVVGWELVIGEKK